MLFVHLAFVLHSYVFRILSISRIRVLVITGNSLTYDRQLRLHHVFGRQLDLRLDLRFCWSIIPSHGNTDIVTFAFLCCIFIHAPLFFTASRGRILRPRVPTRWVGAVPPSQAEAQAALIPL